MMPTWLLVIAVLGALVALVCGSWLIRRSMSDPLGRGEHRVYDTGNALIGGLLFAMSIAALAILTMPQVWS